MTSKVLTQESVDHLRAITKAGTDILARDYDSLVATHSLKEVDLNVKFDDSISLRLPDGSRQEENYDAENCMLIAVNFGTEIQKEEMKEIFQDHNDERNNIGIGVMTSIARKYLIKDILNNIKDKKLSSQINARL